MQDKEVIEWMGEYLNVQPTYYYKYDKNTKTFPQIKLKTKINYISKYLGTGLKPQRHYPIVSEEFEPYLLRGLFDADGSIMGGIRTDRNHFWWRVTFSHHQKCLEGVQKFLYRRLGISSILKQRPLPRTDFILEINKKDDVKKIMDFMYADTDFMPFTRKYEKYIAMRLESDKFMERKK